MTTLTYLANVCSQIDKTWSVSLQYGAHAGETPVWRMCVSLSHKAISLSRVLERGDDMQANMSAARSMENDLKRFMAAQSASMTT